MKLGLCLSGGGAKGAYQAGVIKALYEKGIDKFHSISGTSIGAINGYFIYTDNSENLEKMWIRMEENSPETIKVVDKTVDNSQTIDILKALEFNNLDMNFYVNYVEIENKEVKEKVVNISGLAENSALEAVKYSALLPANESSTLNLKDQFLIDLKEGLYDGYKLDGGLLRNTLVQPLIEDNVDKIIIISTRHDYIIPDYIKNEYDEKNIILVRPNTQFSTEDTLRFEPEFCRKIYKEGYEIGKSISL